MIFKFHARGRFQASPPHCTRTANGSALAATSRDFCDRFQHADRCNTIASSSTRFLEITGIRYMRHTRLQGMHVVSNTPVPSVFVGLNSHLETSLSTIKRQANPSSIEFKVVDDAVDRASSFLRSSAYLLSSEARLQQVFAAKMVIIFLLAHDYLDRRIC